MNLDKKCVSPVVATALLLVVAVVGVVGFQTWFGGFSTKILADVEQDSSSLQNTNIEAIMEDQLYFKNGNSGDVNIQEVKIGNKICNLSGLNISVGTGVTNFSLQNCTQNLTTGTYEVVIISDEEVISRYLRVNGVVSTNNGPTNFYKLNGIVYCPGVSPGNVFELEGVNYTSINNSILLSMTLDSVSYNFSKVCTTHVTNMSRGGSMVPFFDLTDGWYFNQDISSWDVSNVSDMGFMFFGLSFFNQDIGNWSVSKVKNMAGMFSSASSFNQDISSWDVSAVKNMSEMFFSSNFNRDIGIWDVSSVLDMSYMFNANNFFNRDIGIWDVSNVVYMGGMFNGAGVFNQDISNWDVSKVKNMDWMFGNTNSFNQDLSTWNVSAVISCSETCNNAVAWLPKIGRVPVFSGCGVHSCN